MKNFLLIGVVVMLVLFLIFGATNFLEFREGLKEYSNSIISLQEKCSSLIGSISSFFEGVVGSVMDGVDLTTPTHTMTFNHEGSEYTLYLVKLNRPWYYLPLHESWYYVLDSNCQEAAPGVMIFGYAYAKIPWGSLKESTDTKTFLLFHMSLKEYDPSEPVPENRWFANEWKAYWLSENPGLSETPPSKPIGWRPSES